VGASPPFHVAPDLQSQYDAAFQEMLHKPADLDTLFRYAMLAAQTGDLEGAVSALERMLLINADLPRVRLELGVLYYRLGSFEVARTYIETALQSTALPPEARARAEKFLAEIQTRLSKSAFAGEVFFGWRYQSNANLGPPTSSVRLFRQTANLNQSAVGTADWGVVSSIQVRHRYDFGHQDGSALETQLTAYANRQFMLSQANVTLLDLTTGPRFKAFNRQFEDVTLKPFLAGGYIWINDTPYYGSYGAGVEGNMLLSDRLRNTSIAVFRRHNNTDTWYLPTNSQMRGMEYSGLTTFQYQLASFVSLIGTGSATRFEADDAAWQSYQLWGAAAGLSVRFADPVFTTGLPWTVALTYTYQWWNYDAPDPTVDPGVMRIQEDSIVSLVLSIPFDDRTTFTVSGGRFVRSASVPNYQFDNNNVMFGIGWRF